MRGLIRFLCLRKERIGFGRIVDHFGMGGRNYTVTIFEGVVVWKWNEFSGKCTLRGMCPYGCSHLSLLSVPRLFSCIGYTLLSVIML